MDLILALTSGEEKKMEAAFRHLTHPQTVQRVTILLAPDHVIDVFNYYPQK